MDGGGGTVNCQYGVGQWEQFQIGGFQDMQITGQNSMACTCLTAMDGYVGQVTSNITVPTGSPSLIAGVCGCDPTSIIPPPAGVTFTVTGPDGTFYSSTTQSTDTVGVALLNSQLAALVVVSPASGVWTLTVTSTTASDPWRVMIQSLPTQDVVSTWANAAQTEFPNAQLVLFPHEQRLLAMMIGEELGASWWACLGCKVFSYTLAMAVLVSAALAAGPEAAVVTALAAVTGLAESAAMALILSVAGFTISQVLILLCTEIGACASTSATAELAAV
jgi:hypothetical protein